MVSHDQSHQEVAGRDLIAGIGLALLCALMLAAVPSLNAMAYKDGCRPLTLCVFRGAVMMLLSLNAVNRLHKGGVSRSGWLTLFGMCAVYIGFIVANQNAIIVAGVAKSVLLLFTHPLLVVLIQALRGREKLRWIHGAMVCASVAGVAVAASPWNGGMSLVGFALGMAASVFCAGVIIMYDEASSVGLASSTCTFVTGAALVISMLPAVLATEGFYWPHHVWGWCGMIGASVGTSLGLSLFVAAIRKIGTVRTILVGNLEPVMGLGFAAVLAGERLGINVMIGAVMIIVAAVDWLAFGKALRLRPGLSPT